MITLRRHSDRHHLHHAQPEAWHTFHSLERAGGVIDTFGALCRLDELRLPPGAAIPDDPQPTVETVTYVREGTLSYLDTAGQTGRLRAGEFQRRTSALGPKPWETNPSRTDWAHVFRVQLERPHAAPQPGHEEKRFSVAQRRGTLCPIASPDTRGGSLRLHHDVVMYATLLDDGQHIVHPLVPGRQAWLHVVQGGATADGVALTQGDGMGVTASSALSVTATGPCELLLFDLPYPTPPASEQGCAS